MEDNEQLDRMISRIYREEFPTDDETRIRTMDYDFPTDYLEWRLPEPRETEEFHGMINHHTLVISKVDDIIMETKRIGMSSNSARWVARFSVSPVVGYIGKTNELCMSKSEYDMLVLMLRFNHAVKIAKWDEEFNPLPEAPKTTDVMLGGDRRK